MLLAQRLTGGPIGQEIIHGEGLRMRSVCVQSMHQRWSLENNANPGVAMTVDPPLVTLGQAKPTFQVEIVVDLLKLALADEKAGEKARHDLDDLLVNRVFSTLESIAQFVECRLPFRASLLSGFEGRGDLVDVLDVFSDGCLFDPNSVQTSVDAVGQAAELLFREPPFFSSRFRWIDSRTSSNASAILKPGGWRGPPWSSLRIPRTAAQ